MGARLRYAKVVDREEFLRSGAHLRPGLENGVELEGEAPAKVKPFYVLRAWEDFDALTESWRIRDPNGRTLYGPLVREVTAAHGDLADEIDDMRADFAGEAYQLVIDIDGREVARADFPVYAPGEATPAG